MDSTERRNAILFMITNAKKPLTGSQLAERFNVTRQVIVQDVAILRAAGHEIIATPQGYILPHYDTPRSVTRIIAAKHDYSGVEDELMTIVNNGGTVLDVIIYHTLYGEYKGQLMISSLQDVQNFMERLEKEGVGLLSSITEGVHLHTIEASNIETLDAIEMALQEKGYLLKDD